MGIVAGFTKEQLAQAFKLKLQRMDAAIVSRFTFVGETFVNNARAKGSYTDQTGNLRSSICYIVLKDGLKRSPGQIPEQSRKLIDELKAKYMKGYVLLVCAGMDYAAAVESRGKDVLAASSRIAKRQLTAALRTLRKET